MMEIAQTEYLINLAKYLDGETTRGEYARSRVEMIAKLKSSINDLKQQVEQKRNQLEQTKILAELRNENSKLVKEIKNRNTRWVQPYRPIYCHKYYGINTYSCR